MFPRVEVRHLHAVIVLAEELNFTRAADRLHITQSGFSKQINEVEAQHRFQLFIRTNKKNVELTEVGRIFVEEARLALWHIDRAVHAAREGSDSILTIGHSPDADQAWISAILAIRLPMYPKLRIQLISEFSQRVGPARDGRRLESGIGDGTAGKLSDHGCGIRSDASLCRTPADPRSCSKGRHCVPRFGKRRMDSVCSASSSRRS